MAKKTKTTTKRPTDATALEQAAQLAEATLQQRDAEAQQQLTRAIDKTQRTPRLTVRRGAKKTLAVVRPDSREAIQTLTDAAAEGTLVTGADPEPQPDLVAPSAGVEVKPMKARPFCPICAEHFHTQSRHWSLRRIIERHRANPYTDEQLLDWMKRHAALEGLEFPTGR